MADITLRDLQQALDKELARLPANYRAALILCCLEGKTRDEAARCLGVTLAAVKSRLEEGRELLRRRLARRGLALSLALGSFTLLTDAALPAALAESTGRRPWRRSPGRSAHQLCPQTLSPLSKEVSEPCLSRN